MVYFKYVYVRRLPVLIFLVFIFQCKFLSAQDSTSAKPKKINFSGIVLPSRTPENGYLAQGGLVAVYKTQLSDSTLRASNTYLYGMYSQLRQWRISLGGDIFSPKEKYYLNFWYYSSYMPEKYFGLGQDTKPDSSEFVSYSVWHMNTSVLRKLSNNNFAGIVHTLEYTSDSDFPVNGMMAQQQPVGYQSYLANGLGLLFRHDSRDFLLSTQKGFFAEFSLMRFSKAFFSDKAFTSYKLDVRKFYHILPDKGHILGLQLLHSGASGQVPLRFQPSIVTRAYHPNLYRGNSVSSIQAEYRLKIWRWLGASMFGGFAQALDRDLNVAKEAIRPNYGAGLRFKLVPKYNMHLRIEYGIGQNTSNLYLAFYDAF